MKVLNKISSALYAVKDDVTFRLIMAAIIAGVSATIITGIIFMYIFAGFAHLKEGIYDLMGAALVWGR